MAEYVYIWEFIVAPDKRAEFERAYGPAGEWVALFRRSPGYLETLLLHDRERPERYLTLDRWESPEVYEAFRSAYALEYREIDRRSEGLAKRETSLGSFAKASG